MTLLPVLHSFRAIYSLKFTHCIQQSRITSKNVTFCLEQQVSTQFNNILRLLVNFFLLSSSSSSQKPYNDVESKTKKRGNKAYPCHAFSSKFILWKKEKFTMLSRYNQSHIQVTYTPAPLETIINYLTDIKSLRSNPIIREINGYKTEVGKESNRRLLFQAINYSK